MGKVSVRLGADGRYEVEADDPRMARAVASVVGPLAARQVPYLEHLDAKAAAERAERAERVALEALIKARRESEAVAAMRARPVVDEAHRAADDAEAARARAAREAEAAALQAALDRLVPRL